MAMTVKISLCWDATSCTLLETYQRFEKFTASSKMEVVGCPETLESILYTTGCHIPKMIIFLFIFNSTIISV
jgi:hypothetical protein